MSAVEQVVVFLYALAPVLSSVGYLPQIRKVLKSAPHELRGISVHSWLIWFANALIAVAYGVVRIHDPLFITVSSISAGWCALLITLTLWKQAQADPVKISADQM